MVTYLSSTSVVLILRASKTCFTPSAPSLLPRRLQARGKCECQWLLGSCQIGQVCGGRVCGGIPERLEGRIRLECLRQVLRATGADAVRPETAKQKLSGSVNDCRQQRRKAELTSAV